jgi:acyl transferase domain-containing protein/NADPH:quinone reductase-like Zn-dependent oxidoreductase/ubiquinone/menaquinone biosynthesis C-methylase UbiE
MSANRISHVFDFRGASMTLETGCSTTLVALHQAVQSLRCREADMSVVTGVNLMVGPEPFKTIGSLGMLSPDGRSYAFDSRANGYGRGEGVATVVIKRLSDALAANDPIRAVIRETALNQDGKTETITTPSGPAQEALIRECYRRAGLDPRGTQYFEAHGTGTQAGDPIEARVMANVFSGVDDNGDGGRDEAHYLRIGSVKTNVGHTEAASGLAAIVKGVLCLEKGLIPASVNYEKPNPKVKLDEWRLKLVTALEPWPESLVDGPNRLSVNNFGYGGTNAHVIMESAEPWTSTPTVTFPLNNGISNGNGTSNVHSNGNGHINGNSSTHKTADTKVLILSARDERGCQRLVGDMKSYLEKHKSLNFEAANALLRDLTYTLAERRTRFPWVAAHQVHLEAGAEQPLDAVIEAFDSPRFKPSRVPTTQPRIGMVFTGQGAQWNAMGRELLTEYPVFRQSIDEADTHLRDIGATWSLLEELQCDPQTTKVHSTSISIPVCVGVQIALVRLLKSWGITPAAVTSHSSGEIAAAYTVGALTFRQAMATAYYRAVLAADESLRVPGAPKGGMAAVGLGAEEAQEYLDRVADVGKVVIACVNSPESVTVSGDADAVVAVEAMCKEDGVFARKLKIEQAYHSHHMDPLADAYRELLRKEMAGTVTKELNGEGEELNVIFSSAVTGGRITDAKEIADPDHWVGSLVQPVQFVDAFTEMVLGETDDASGRSIDVVLEVGPHTALGGPIREIMSLVEFDGIELPYWGCLVRNEHAGNTMRAAAINLLREGVPLVMSEINFPKSLSEHSYIYDDDLPRVLIDLPTYPWNHSMRHWQEARVNRAIRERSQPPHDLLGMPVAGNDPATAVWRRTVRVSEVPWVRDHMVQGSIVYPGSGYVCLAIEAAKQLAKGEDDQKKISGFRLRDVDFMAALMIPDSSDGVEIRTTLRPVPERELGLRGWRRFEVSTVTPENRWTLHAQGLVKADVEEEWDEAQTKPENDQTGLRPLSAYTRHKDPRDMFANLRALGVYHGPLFQNTTKIVQDGREPRSVSDITIRYESAADTDPVAAAQDSVLHPITLDAVVVSFFSALPGVGAVVEDPKLPRSIDAMWVSSDISREIGHTLRCDTSLSHDDPQSGRADVTVVDSQTGAIVLKIQGLATFFLGRGSGATARQDAANKGEEVCSKVEWGPDLSLKQPLALAHVKKELELTFGIPETIVTDLSRAVFYFAQEALKSLTPDDVVRLKDEQLHLFKYYTWLTKLVAQGENLKWAIDGPEERQKNLTAVSSKSVDGELICRLGPLIGSILRGESNPLVAMIEDGLLHKYYAHSVRLAPSLAQLSTLVRKVAHKNPAARVLQVGAGTGGAATRRILEALGTPKVPLVAIWHITEPSADVLEDVQADLVDWSDLLEFSQLDIDSDPSKQKFAPESYDIIVFYQSLRTAKDVPTTLAYMRSLLKPAGTLLLAETTQNEDQADISFIFGLLPTETPSPLMSSWDRVLSEAGFSGADLAIGDTTTTILSTLPLAEHQKPDLSRASNPGGFAVVTSNKTPSPAGLVDLLSQRIQDLTKTTVQHLVMEESSLDAYEAKVCIFVSEIDEPTILTDLDAERIEGLRAMITQCGGLLWITTGGAVDSEQPEHALAQGFLRVLRNEYVGRRYLYLDLDPCVKQSTEDIVSTIAQVLEQGFGYIDDVLATEIGPAEFEYAERNGVLLVPRIYKDEEHNDMVTGPLTATWGDLDATASIPLEPLFQKNRPLRLEVGIPGHLDTLAFVDDDEHSTESLASESVEITPRAFGLSSRDVMASLGQLKDRAMGLECAGIVSRIGTEAQAKGDFKIGDRVMALLPGDGSACLRNSVTVAWNGSIVKVPNNITSFEDAASLPLAFTIAYAGLVDAARLAPGQSVLIHAAAGAIGQAAIMLAKHLGVTEIFATVGSAEKRDLISSKYGIPTQRIFSSRNTSFGPAVLASTGGRGVDVVLNSLPGPLLQASLDALAPLGYLVEVGKRDIEANGLLALASFSRGISMTALDIPMLVQRRGADVHRVLAEVAKLIEQHVLTPVQPVTVHPIQDVQAAFKFIQTGAHTGKVVLSAGPDEQAPVVPRLNHVAAASRVRLRSDASYIVVGGVGGIGRSVAHWLVAHGAKNLILLSRSAGQIDLPENQNTDGALFVRELRESAGCRVKPVSCDISLASELTKALRASADDGFPPVRGIIQGAMLLRDAIFEQMTLDDWHSGLRPKVDGTWNLHTEFAAPDSLDFFVMLSSVSGILGIASQTNYAAGGSYEDAMAYWRQSKGLPGVSIDLGPISDVGYVAETAKVAERLRKSGDYVMLDEATVLRALGAAVARPLGGRRQIIIGLNTAPGQQWDARGGSQLGRDARYVHLKRQSRASRAALVDDESGAGVSLSTQLAEVGSREDAARLISTAIAAKLADIFMIDVAEIDISKTPASYGVDSLIAVELRNMLVLQAAADVSIFNILQSASLAALAADVAAKSRHVEAAA